MKKIMGVIISISIMLSMFVQLNVFAAESTIHSSTNNVLITGRVENPVIDVVTVCLEDASSQMVYLNEFPIAADGSYTCKFKFNPTQSISSYKLKLNAGGVDISDTVLTAVTTKETEVVSLKLTNESGKSYISDSELVKVKASIQNYYTDSISGNLIVAYYDSNNILQGAKNVPIEFGFDVNQIIPETQVSVPNVAYVKAFLWCDDQKPLALSQSVAHQTSGLANMQNTNNEITALFIGGSITIGSNYNTWAKYVKEDYLEAKYSKVNYYNIAIGGTNSRQAVYRVQKDVAPVNPDIVFVEFTVNDNGLTGYQVYQEGLIRQLLQLPKKPVIVYVYTFSTTGSGATTEGFNGTKTEYQRIADAYGIGSVDIHAYIDNSITAKLDGFTTWEAFRTTYMRDRTHPNDLGSKIYGDYVVSQLNSNPQNYLKEQTMAPLMFGYDFNNPDLLLSTDKRISYSSGWTHIPESSLTFSDRFNLSYWKNGIFGDGTMYAEAIGETITYSFTGNSFGLYVLRNAYGGKISYDIDNGKKTGTFNAYSNDSNRPVVIGELHGLGNGAHTITLRTTTPSAEATAAATAAGKVPSVQIGCFLVDEAN